MLKEVQKFSEIFFEKLGLEIDSLEVINEDENIFLIKIQSNESPLIIGSNGKNLDNIISILKLILRKNINDNLKLHLEVNDYQKSKDDKLKQYIIGKIKIVENKGIDIKLPFFSAYDRKKIHSFVADYNNPKIYTKSFGDGAERRLFICKVNEKITIDMDGNDI